VTVDDGRSFLTGLRARALPLLAQPSLTVTASPDSPTWTGLENADLERRIEFRVGIHGGVGIHDGPRGGSTLIGAQKQAFGRAKQDERRARGTSRNEQRTQKQ
jgi:hypothetical protein